MQLLEVGNPFHHPVDECSQDSDEDGAVALEIVPRIVEGELIGDGLPVLPCIRVELFLGGLSGGHDDDVFENQRERIRLGQRG